jgi:hypothetical protein
LAWLAFTKKSQIRKIALLEFKHLLNILENTSGIPPDWASSFDRLARAAG